MYAYNGLLLYMMLNHHTFSLIFLLLQNADIIPIIMITVHCLVFLICNP